MTILREGFLTKEGRIRRSWKRRYCVLILENSSGLRRIMYYTDGSKSNLKGYVDLNEAVEISTDAENSNRFEINCTSRIWKFQADTIVDRIDWVNSVTDAMTKKEETTLPPEATMPDMVQKKDTTNDFDDLLFGSNKVRADSDFTKTLYTPHGSNLTIRFSTTPNFSALADIKIPSAHFDSFDMGYVTTPDSRESVYERRSLSDVDIPTPPPAQPPAQKHELIVTEHKVSDTTESEHMITQPSF